MHTYVQSLIHAAHINHNLIVIFFCPITCQSKIIVDDALKNKNMLTQSVLDGLSRRYRKTRFSPDAISLDSFLNIYEKKTNKEVVIYLTEEVSHYLMGMRYNDVVTLLVNYLYLSLEANSYDDDCFNSTMGAAHV